MKYTRILEAKTRPYRRQFDELTRNTNKELNQDTLDLANTFMKEAFAEAVILDWTGITNVKGKKVVYSPEAATKLLIDLSDLFVELR